MNSSTMRKVCPVSSVTQNFFFLLCLKLKPNAILRNLLSAAVEAHQDSEDQHEQMTHHEETEHTAHVEAEAEAEAEAESNFTPETSETVHSDEEPDVNNKEKPTSEQKSTAKYVKPKSTKAEDNQLTAELVRQYAIDNVVMVTWANHHYHDFVRNWVLNVRKCDVSNFLVGSMDNELLEKLIADEVPTFAMQSGMTTQDFGWGTQNFHKMGRKKIELIYLFTKMGFDILVSDVDTVWMKNPMPYMARYPSADILTSSDHLSHTTKSDGLENPAIAYSPANIGIMLLRHTAKDLAKEWVEVLEKDDKIWDQNAFNDLYRRGARGSPDGDNLMLGYKGNLRIGILPVSIFASGHTFFVQKMYEKLKLEPYVVHATFQFSGTEGKRHRMREALLWQDEPAYYDPAGGLLTFTPDIPEELLRSSGTVDGHFKLVNHQLLQIRNALAISQQLGRTLVMPKLWCGFDRWWAPHHGKLPGSETELPFMCPMDHIFEVETWLRPMDEKEAGPNIAFREHSFLNNPSVPKNVLDSEVTIDFVSDCTGDTPCTQGESETAPGNSKNIVAKKQISDTEIQHLLKDYKDTKVLRFTTMLGVFSGFEDPEKREQFSKRIKRYAGLWCCIHAHPGHIWYDMEFDMIPHTDRHNRLWEKPWEPTAGP